MSIVNFITSYLILIFSQKTTFGKSFIPPISLYFALWPVSSPPHAMGSTAKLLLLLFPAALRCKILFCLFLLPALFQNNEQENKDK